MVTSLTPNLVLVGFMGSGKSTIGRRCAHDLGYGFVDTDSIIEAQERTSVAEIFAARGESGFRDLETAAIEEAASRDHRVIATGGGAVLRQSNREALRRTGIVIWLRITPEEIVARCGDGRTRPLLARSEDPLGRVTALLQEREPAYAAAAHRQVCSTGLTRREAAQRVLRVYDELKRTWCLPAPSAP